MTSWIEAAPLPVEMPVDLPGFSSPGFIDDAFHVLIWQARGHCQVTVGSGERFSVTTGNALWIPAHVLHRFTTARNSVSLPMLFEPRTTVTALDVPTLVPIDAHDEPLLLALIGTHYSIIEPGANLEQMVASLVEAKAAAPAVVTMPRSPAALRIARTVVLNPADPRTLADWASELHLSTRSLERAFVAETGLTWLRWRQTCRMAKAAQLLQTTTASVTGIASRVGFSAHSSFARAFREFHGTSPTEFRRRSSV